MNQELFMSQQKTTEELAEKLQKLGVSAKLITLV
jgi:hypothetical protein